MNYVDEIYVILQKVLTRDELEKLAMILVYDNYVKRHKKVHKNKRQKKS